MRRDKRGDTATGDVSAQDDTVVLTDLTKRFDGLTVVDRLNLSVGNGEFFSIIGPSGCGKTTTLRMIAGFEAPSSGRVFLHGRDITETPPYQRPVNTVFQHYALFPHLDVFENVAFGLRERKAAKHDIERKTRAILDLVGLSGRERSKPAALSGGEQQRVALARCLVLDPDVLLLDEPLGALDLKLRRQMQEYLRRVQREVGITFIFVTHDQEESFAMSDRIGVMRSGILEQVGSPIDVYRQPRTRFAADFVGASNLLVGQVEREPSPGAYVVDLERFGGGHHSAGVPGCPSGSSVALMIRPESVRLERVERDASGVIGKVTDITFRGSQVTFEVRLYGMNLLAANSDMDHRTAPRVGDPVRASWSPDDCWVLPSDA